MPRLFVAVRVPLFDALAEALRPLIGLRGVAAVAPENFHYTLRFLGDVPEDVGAALVASFQPGRFQAGAFDVALEGLSAFPSRQAPKVIWVGSDAAGAAGLHRLADSVDGMAADAGVGRRDKPFVAHLTVARVKRATDKAMTAVRALMAAHVATSFGVHRVSTVALVRSDLRPSGPVYSNIAEVALA